MATKKRKTSKTSGKSTARRKSSKPGTKETQKIVPFLWFDDQAEEATRLYTSLFSDSKIDSVVRYPEAAVEVSGRPAGSVMTVSFRLAGQEFSALNGGPVFKFTPAISFFVNCESDSQIETIWQKLSDGGSILMEFGKYPFSNKFGWLNDKFGVSWQLALDGKKQKITPYLLFVGSQHGKAEAAINFYTSLFGNSKVRSMDRHPAGGRETAGTVRQAMFTLDGQEFRIMDSSLEHSFTFNESVSFLVKCKDQKEVDELWGKMSKVPESEQCGWLKDQFGVSWQIVPTVLFDLLSDPQPRKSEAVTKALLQMKKIDIAGLKQAYAQA